MPQLPNLDAFSLEDILAAVDSSKGANAAARRSDEVFDWVLANWKLFAVTKSLIRSAIEEADTSFGHTEDGLASALGLPSSVFLVRGKAENVKARYLFNAESSPLLETFDKLARKAGSGDVAVIYVAGALSVVITTMQTTPLTGASEVVVDRPGGQVHIFPAAQLNARLPQIRRLGDNG